MKCLILWKKNAKIAQFMCKLYENLDVLSIARKKMLIGPCLTQLYFWEYGVGKEGFMPSCNEEEIKACVKIYPIDYFSPLQYGSKISLDFFTNRTCLAHHYGGSWLEENKNKTYGFKTLDDYVREENKLCVFINKLCTNVLRFFFRIIAPRDSNREKYLKNLARKIIS